MTIDAQTFCFCRVRLLVLPLQSVRCRYKDPTDSPHLRELLALQLLRELTVHSQAGEFAGRQMLYIQQPG